MVFEASLYCKNAKDPKAKTNELISYEPNYRDGKNWKPKH